MAEPVAPSGPSPADAGRQGPLLAAVLIVLLTLVAAAAIELGGSGSPGTGLDDGTATRTAARSNHDHGAMALDDPPVWSDGVVAIPTRHLGAQGGFGQFVAECGYSHSAEVDPIVFPHTVGRSHRHDFYGATTTDEHSTPESLRAGGTTCDKPGDDAAYWQPTLYDGDTAVVPIAIHAYYRAAPGIDPTTVQPYPDGLMMLAGDPFATEPQAGDAAGWTCGVRTDLSDEPPACPVTAPLSMVLTFPDCWDGEHADVAGHRAHMTYSRAGACPADHPVPVPQLTVAVAFPVVGGDHDLHLSSGSVRSAHGDFFNGWHAEALQREIRSCIHRDVVCDLASNRQEEGPFFAR